jgi:hypothetical protein
MRLFFLLILFLIISCAPKVERECVVDKSVYGPYLNRKVPKDFRVYGLIKYGPVRLPLMLAKFDGFYTVRVAKAGDISIDSKRICIERKCYILPAPPEELIFGKLLTGREYSFCRKGLIYFRLRGDVYERLVVFGPEGPEELSLINVRKNKSVKVLFGEEDPKGFFRELRFLLDGGEVKLLIEEVET